MKNYFYHIPIICFLVMNTLFGNYAFKKKVKEVCKSYRISIESSQLELGNSEVIITMESGRNNFEMYMLVGFASAGQAIAHQNEMNLSNAYTPLVVSLNIAVPASRNEFNTFIASCSSEMAISLANGSMDSSEFMQEIMKNIKIQ
ncbi:MAG: hypothetical protein CMF94_01955 [Candidatus Marinimicrobia bacterium]|nr:hypothetical protein [Candidatus Neomarinimicrobiota bacterium]